MESWDKNDMVRLLPGADGAVRAWREPTQAELWKWIRESGEAEGKAPRLVEAALRPEGLGVLIVSEVASAAPEGFEGPKEICRLLDMDTGALWWVAPEHVAPL